MSNTTSLLVANPGPVAAATPAWFVEGQTAAWAEFEALPFPSRRDEMWRFSTVKGLALERYTPAPASSADVAAEVERRSLPDPAGRLVFLNDRLVTAELFDESLRDAGVTFTSLEDALATDEALLRRHFMAQPARLGSQKFAALHQALVRAGSLLHVPKGVEVSRAFEVFHFVAGADAAIFPHTLIVAEPASRLTLIDHFVSLDDDAPGFACGVNDLIVKDGAHLTYVAVQDWSRRFTSVQINTAVVGRDAAATNLSLNFGGRYARSESVSRLHGPGGRSDMLALSVGRADQEFDQRTHQDHLQPNTTSDLLYKNALFDESRSIFSGLIKVEPGAHRTDAYQKVRNLLLSDDAEANSMPGLEILADDVRCTHGATSGQVEAEELFYLKSRGIPELAAKELVVRGFLNEVVNRLSDGPLRAYLHDQIERHL